MTQLTTATPKAPSTLDIEEAIAKLPAGSRVQVVQQSAVTGKPDVAHVWHRDFAADKIRFRGAQRTYDATYSKFGMYFADENGDRFYIETQPTEG